MSLKRFQPGETVDEFPGRTWNALVDGEERDRARHRNPSGPAVGATDGDVPNPARVLVKNSSGSVVLPGGVLKLTGALVDPADNPSTVFDGPMLIGNAPTADDPAQSIGVAFEPIKPNFLGYCVLAGAVWAKLNISDEAHTFAQPKASVDELESSASVGYPVIWKESGTGAGKWAVVKLTTPVKTINIIHGLSVGAVTGGAITLDNIELMNGVDPREDPEDAAEEVAVENPFSWDIDDNGLVRAEQADDGTWIAVQAACPA